MSLEWFCKRFCKCTGTKLSPPRFLEDIDFNEVTTLLKSIAPDAARVLVDADYKTTTVTEFKRFIKHNKVDMEQYVSEYFDCDDFSFALKGAISNPDWGALTFGIVFAYPPRGGAHALNFFIDNEGIFWLVEPQTDKVFKPTDKWKIYYLMM